MASNNTCYINQKHFQQIMAERDTHNTDERVIREKKDLLDALSKNSGIVASACRACNISRMTYYRYYREDPDFKEKADDVKELLKDFAENLILKKMREGDTTMIIFYAKTQMKDRGYTERSEITGKDGKDLMGGSGIDLSKLTDEQREVLLSIGLDYINRKDE